MAYLASKRWREGKILRPRVLSDWERAELVFLRRQGLFYRELRDRFGITEERCRQVIAQEERRA